MTKEFQSLNDEQEFSPRARFFGLGHLELFSHSSLGFRHLPNGDLRE
jgi:hypothetical protein